MKEINKAGYVQGDMSPKVEDYQKPASDFSQEGFSKTTDYVARQDARQKSEAGKVRSNSYKGRYS